MTRWIGFRKAQVTAREIVEYSSTNCPLLLGMRWAVTATWAAQQVVEALPWESAAKYLFRDGDGIYGDAFIKRMEGLGLTEIVTARGSPWQNGHCARVIGTLRRECLDHVVAVDEDQLLRVLKAYVAYYYSTSQCFTSLSA
jgi:transposase InsO family protein